MNLPNILLHGGEWFTIEAAVALIMAHKQSSAAGEARVILRDACASGAVRSRDIEPDWDNTDQDGNILSVTALALIPADAWRDGLIDLPEVYGQICRHGSYAGYYDGHLAEISRDDLTVFLNSKWPVPEAPPTATPTMDQAILQILSLPVRPPIPRLSDMVRERCGRRATDHGWSDRTIRRRIEDIEKR